MGLARRRAMCRLMTFARLGGGGAMNPRGGEGDKFLERG
jgi:hypothetical protein